MINQGPTTIGLCAPDAAKLTDTACGDWKYVSEGNSTLVVSYSGAPVPGFNGTVLRLRKTGRKDAAKPLAGSELDDPMIEFQEKIIQRLIPTKYLVRLQSIQSQEDWLKRLKSHVEPERPSPRPEQDGIDLTRRKAILATDLVGNERWAVEIKPKWGFLPSPDHLSPSTRPIKTTTCRYCMHAHFKSLTGEAAAHGYCPLDLYSRDRNRVTKAVICLWDAWTDTKGAVNNLKIFVNGRTVNPTDPHAMKALRRVFGSDAESPEFLRDSFISSIAPILLSTLVLPILSNLQRTLDPLDAEGLSTLLSLVPDAPTLNREPTTSEYSSFLDAYLTSHSRMDHSNPKVNVDTARYYTLAYMLSATFKDCSIIVRPTLVGESEGEEPGRNAISIIDLDPKPIRKLRQWIELDRKIIDAYKNVENKRLCVDALQRLDKVFSGRIIVALFN